MSNGGNASAYGAGSSAIGGAGGGSWRVPHRDIGIPMTVGGGGGGTEAEADKIGQQVMCTLCTDNCISGKIDESEINPMFTMAPMQMMVQVNISQAVPFMVVVPMCMQCRNQQLRPGGLLHG